MFAHIVVPLDGSKFSEAVLAFVVPLAKRLNSGVVLLHAESDPYADMFGGERAAEMYRVHRSERNSSSSLDYLEGVCERLRSESVRCETFIDYGAPAVVILDYIEEHSPDLLAMSTHGRSGIRRMVVGSVTTAILPRAGIPVLVAHPRDDDGISESSFTNIVVPLDMSERSEDVLPLATELAYTLESESTFITCLPSPAQMYTGAVPEVYPFPDDLMQQAQGAADEYLENLCAAVNEGRDLNTEWESLEGGPASRIVEYAELQPNSLIAMCTQGRTGLGRWVLGSVTDTVIRTGNTPVLVVPHTEETD